MAATDRITMTMRELDRLKVIQTVVDRMLKPGLAAERLRLTVRQVERLVLRYKQAGAAGVGSAARGRPGNRKLDEATAYRALILIRDRYADFGPTLACEKLREAQGLTLSKETVRHLMADAGLWIPRKQRPPKIHQPRNRRACLGELIQIDGSDHRWFEERAPACTLLVFIDDATSRLMTLHFTATESTFSYFEATRPVHRGVWQASRTLQRPRERVPLQQSGEHARQGRNPIRAGLVRVERGYAVCQQQPDQGTRGARQPDFAGPAREGVATAQDRHEGSGERLCAPFHC
jgi:transposase